MPIDLRSIASVVRIRREHLRITQSQLSVIAGVALRTVRQVEQGSGNPSIQTLLALFDALGLELKLEIKNKGINLAGVLAQYTNEGTGKI